VEPMNRGWLGAGVLLSVLAAGCSGSPKAGSGSTEPNSNSRTPVQGAESWFKPINAKDQADAGGRFQPSARAQME
jgi:hypothetical protein